jgi:hypothetical protein
VSDSVNMETQQKVEMRRQSETENVFRVKLCRSKRISGVTKDRRICFVSSSTLCTSDISLIPSPQVFEGFVKKGNNVVIFSILK